MRLKELFLSTCKVFGRLGIGYAVIGGYAAIIYGSPYMTKDIDFVVASEKVGFSLLSELKKLGWKPTEKYEDIRELQAFGQFTHELGIALHILPEAKGYRLREGIVVNEEKIDGERISVCSPEDYIIMRAALWTEEDRMKAIIVARARKLDAGYLKRRAQEEGVSERLEWVLERSRRKK